MPYTVAAPSRFTEATESASALKSFGEMHMSKEIKLTRRRFLGAGVMTIAAAEFGIVGGADAQSGKEGPTDAMTMKPGTYTSFRSLKQIDAGVLNVGYAEAGPAYGPAIILLHGWPYDIHSYVDVAPLLRGYGTTRFLSSDTMRNGQQSAVAVDIIALIDALKIEEATIAGCDWGARTANIIAALWPQHRRHSH
jgi:hypothetical protein